MKYLVAALLIVSIGFAAFPRPVGYVNDFANILPDRAEFEQGLSEYERNTTIETVVVTLESVPQDHTLFSYGVALFDDWNIGKKGEDNGLLILIVKNGTPGNRLRIEVGYGLQGYITGAEAGRILDDALPYYEKGDYETVLDIILMGLSDQLESYQTGTAPRNDITFSDSPVLYIMLLIFSVALDNLPLTIFVLIILGSLALSNRCPYCGGRLKASGDSYVCTRCGRRISRKKRYAPYMPGGSWGGGGGGGFGGFGGGGSGGGGAGR